MLATFTKLHGVAHQNTVFFTTITRLFPLLISDNVFIISDTRSFWRTLIKWVTCTDIFHSAKYSIKTFLCLRGRRSGVRIPAGTGYYFFLKIVQTGRGAHQPPIELVPGFCPDDKATFDTISTSHLRLLPRLRKGGVMFAFPYIIITIHNQK
jgi:hypothetical protein